MRIEHMTPTSIFAHLEIILKEDIKSLKSKIDQISDNERLNDFIKSLCSAKEEILAILPTDHYNQEIDSVSTPPQKGYFAGYSKDELNQISDQVGLIELFLKTEESQSQMIMNGSVSNAIPSNLKKVLGNILDKSLKIVDHLRRTKYTQQLGTIVVS